METCELHNCLKKERISDSYGIKYFVCKICEEEETGDYDIN